VVPEATRVYRLPEIEEEQEVHGGDEEAAGDGERLVGDPEEQHRRPGQRQRRQRDGEPRERAEAGPTHGPVCVLHTRGALVARITPAPVTTHLPV
jgi:hypothetical protein